MFETCGQFGDRQPGSQRFKNFKTDLCKSDQVHIPSSVNLYKQPQGSQ